MNITMQFTIYCTHRSKELFINVRSSTTVFEAILQIIKISYSYLKFLCVHNCFKLLTACYLSSEDFKDVLCYTEEISNVASRCVTKRGINLFCTMNLYRTKNHYFHYG